MSLYVLTTIDPQASRGTADWYFESHAHFIRAKKAAEDNHIYIHDRKDFVTDFDEFREWLRERAKEAV
ncbi:MAG TPA: hypothetical protein PKZ27_03000 [Rhodocyclaceae bacterium]|nr:hypothetical protein [Burkholderiaceae bacterium]HRP74534.1 hypothetical protein [Rhodocyclaceae bacterium]